MTSTKSNKPPHAPLPLYEGVPAWPGVQVLLTQTGEQGFNLGTHVGDHVPDVERRRAALQAHVGVPILWLNQVHGCDVYQAHPIDHSNPPTSDASISASTHMALAIMTADCLPVVFAAFDAHGKAVGVAAAHAGWRGLHAGVLQATALQLSALCAVPTTQIKAWMGPAIGPQSFEVGSEVFKAFVEQSERNQSCFNVSTKTADHSKQNPASGAAKYFANIYELARFALQGIGVSQIGGGGLDTFTDSRWFSHRRAQQLGQPQGRFATLIQLLPACGA